MGDRHSTRQTQVSKVENLENTQAIRKLMRIGFQHCVAALYKEGKFSLREAAKLLGVPLSRAIDQMNQIGVSGNIPTHRM